MGRYRFGSTSRSRLSTAHPLLQEVMEEAILRTPMDFTVLEGYRGRDAQEDAVRRGTSTVHFPNSQHNHEESGKPCSLAVDVAPWYHVAPHVRWNSPDEFRWLAGFVMGIGARIVEPQGYRLRWGGDWDGDGDHGDSSFIDLPHLEIVSL